tara:strand:+ start:13320 stop:14201 length:882 start_codon:yes stop_codon:yes gene_type:complete
MEMEKVAKIYTCYKCDYKTNNKTNFLKHKLTRKHNIATMEKQEIPKLHFKFQCEICKKEYKSGSGLWKHKKRCTSVTTDVSVIPSDNELIKIIYEQHILLQNENKELKSEMIKQNKELLKIIPKIGNTTNNKFNINLYLNEHCQNAMNLKDFVNSVKLCIEDMLVAGNRGVIYSSKNIIVNNLKALEEMKRPIHCTDVKRNTMYVKDDGIWDKDIQNEKLKGAINKISSEHLKNVPLWVAKNPNYMNSSKGQDEFFKIVNETSIIVSDDKRGIQSAIKQIGEGVHISNAINTL